MCLSWLTQTERKHHQGFSRVKTLKLHSWSSNFPPQTLWLPGVTWQCHSDGRVPRKGFKKATYFGPDSAWVIRKENEVLVLVVKLLCWVESHTRPSWVRSRRFGSALQLCGRNERRSGLSETSARLIVLTFFFSTLTPRAPTNLKARVFVSVRRAIGCI